VTYPVLIAFFRCICAKNAFWRTNFVFRVMKQKGNSVLQG